MTANLWKPIAAFKARHFRSGLSLPACSDPELP